MRDDDAFSVDDADEDGNVDADDVDDVDDDDLILMLYCGDSDSVSL